MLHVRSGISQSAGHTQLPDRGSTNHIAQVAPPMKAKTSYIIPHLNGWCRRCERWGHRACDCRRYYEQQLSMYGKPAEAADQQDIPPPPPQQAPEEAPPAERPSSEALIGGVEQPALPPSHSAVMLHYTSRTAYAHVASSANFCSLERKHFGTSEQWTHSCRPHCRRLARIPVHIACWSRLVQKLLLLAWRYVASFSRT